MASDPVTTDDSTRDTTSQGAGTASGHLTAMPAALKREVNRPAAPIDPLTLRARNAYEGLNASSVGLELGISVILGLVGGYYADKALGSTPWLMLLGLVFGLIAGFRGVMRYVRRADRQAERDAGDAKEAPRG